MLFRRGTEHLRRRTPDHARSVPFFDQQGFGSLLRRQGPATRSVNPRLACPRRSYHPRQ